MRGIDLVKRRNLERCIVITKKRVISFLLVLQEVINTMANTIKRNGKFFMFFRIKDLEKISL